MNFEEEKHLSKTELSSDDMKILAEFFSVLMDWSSSTKVKTILKEKDDVSSKESNRTV